MHLHVPLAGLGSKLSEELQVSQAVPLLHDWHPNNDAEQSLHVFVSRYFVVTHWHFPPVTVSLNPTVESHLVHTFSLSQFRHPGVVHRTHCLAEFSV